VNVTRWQAGALALALLAAGGLVAQESEKPSVPQARAVIVASHDVQLVSPVRGVIKRVLVEEGDRVAKDQPLVELDAEVQKASLAKAEEEAKSTAALVAAEANLQVKRAEYKRQKMLFDKQVNSEADLEKADFDLKYAETLVTVRKEEQKLGQLSVKLEQERLNLMCIRAPLAGIVLRRLEDVGEAALEDRPVLRLVVLDVLHVIAYVPYPLASKLKVGMAARVALDDQPEARLPCRVLMVDPMVDAASDTCRVKLELANPDHKVAAGSRATVLFDTGPSPTAAVAPPVPEQRRP